MKSTLIRISLLALVGMAPASTPFADNIKLDCPKLNSFLLDHYDDSSEPMSLQNAITFPLSTEQGGGWVVRFLFAENSPWNFADIVIQSNGISDGLTAWKRAKNIKQASMQAIPVLKKHFFNRDRTGSYFFTCSYPINAQYAIAGDRITVSSTIYTDGVGTSKVDNGTESVLYDYFSRQCGDENLCMLR